MLNLGASGISRLFVTVVAEAALESRGPFTDITLPTFDSAYCKKPIEINLISNILINVTVLPFGTLHSCCCLRDSLLSWFSFN